MYNYVDYYGLLEVLQCTRVQCGDFATVWLLVMERLTMYLVWLYAASASPITGHFLPKGPWFPLWNGLWKFMLCVAADFTYLLVLQWKLMLCVGEIQSRDYTMKFMLCVVAKSTHAHHSSLYYSGSLCFVFGTNFIIYA